MPSDPRNQPLSASSSSQNSPYFTAEHDMLRESLRRFLETDVKPHADKWEEAGFVPRHVLAKMGENGFLGIRHAEQYGGANMDVLGTVVLAEELGRSTYGGFAVTVLVHTDMASPHLANAGTAAQQARWMPDLVAGRKICAVAVTEPEVGNPSRRSARSVPV